MKKHDVSVVKRVPKWAVCASAYVITVSYISKAFLFVLKFIILVIIFDLAFFLSNRLRVNVLGKFVMFSEGGFSLCTVCPVVSMQPQCKIKLWDRGGFSEVTYYIFIITYREIIINILF